MTSQPQAFPLPKRLHTLSRCVRQNVWHLIDHPKYPWGMGTGFLAKRDRQVFYFTARHCARDPTGDDHQPIPHLWVPIRDRKPQLDIDKDWLELLPLEPRFDPTSENGNDLLAFAVSRPDREKDFKELLSRSAKLPHDDLWLKRFLASKHRQQSLGSGVFRVYVLGCPRELIDHPIDLEAACKTTSILGLSATLEPEDDERTLRIKPEVKFLKAFSGLSGSPVFLENPTIDSGPQFVLIGMVLTGASPEGGFLRVLPLGHLIQATQAYA